MLGWAKRAGLALWFCAAPLCGLTQPLSAQELERVEVDAATAEEAVIPGFQVGAWRYRTQLVWDGMARRLVRRQYEIWDPLAEQDWDLFWAPGDPAKDRQGRVAGQGRLVWRVRGAPSYDASAAVAQYEGTMLDGVASGQGEFRHRSGAAYRGGWKAGLMDGQGRLILPNGDEYVGGFKAGRRHGEGAYIDRTGMAYRGGFHAGLREGLGVVSSTQSGVYRSLWRNGLEVPGSRVVERIGAAATPAADSVEAVRLGILVDRRAVNDLNGTDTEMLYVSESDGEALRIFPDDERLLDVWRGRSPIEVREEEVPDDGWPMSFLGTYRFNPVPLIFDIENTSTRPLRIMGGHLDVATSVRDPEPAVQVTPAESGFCPVFVIENHGWSEVLNPRLKISFRGADTPTIDLQLDPIDKELEIDLREHLAKAGMENLAAEVPCSGNPDACFDRVRRAGTFGRFSDAVELYGSSFLLYTKGILNYEWRDAEGTTHEKSSRFSVELPIGKFQFSPETGEGGLLEELRKKPFRFNLDKSNYRISLPIADDLPAGVISRWRMRLDAPETSVHTFRLVLDLAGGRQVASRPIRLEYFLPPYIENNTDLTSCDPMPPLGEEESEPE